MVWGDRHNEARKSTGDYGKPGDNGQRLIHHGGAHPISAVFGLRYLHDLVRRWAVSRNQAVQPQRRHAAGGMVIGANGDSTAKIDGPGGAWRRCRGRVSRPRQLRLVGQVRQPRRSQIRRFLQPPGGGDGRARAEGRRHLPHRQALYRGRAGLRARGRPRLSRRRHGLLVWRRFPRPADRQWRSIRHGSR